MKIRPFDWRDLPVLLRYRNRGLFFDNTLALTRGQMRVPAGALLSYFAPATGIFTYLLANNAAAAEPVIGQVMHDVSSPYARLSFLAPDFELESLAVPKLLEYMIRKIGERGAFHLLAEVDENAIAFEVLRRTSFAIYARQRIWRLSGDSTAEPHPAHWRAGTRRDSIPVKSLYHNLVPVLVQQVEPPPSNHTRGLVYCQEGELFGYIELKYGPRGIWAQPFIHPDAEQIDVRLVDLLKDLPDRRNRPVYVCVRSYQSWLEPALEDLGAQPGPRQAVMVKHLAISKRIRRSFPLRALEGGHPEVTAHLVRSESKERI